VILDTNQAEKFRCPTCGAQQAVSAECRRCKCDLSLVVAIHQQRVRLHHDCLRHLRDGELVKARACARKLHDLSPNVTSRRLLAVACLHLGEFRTALAAVDGE